MLNPDVIRHQLIEDLDRLLDLIVRYAQGERNLKQDRDRLERAIQVKMALLAGKKESADAA